MIDHRASAARRRKPRKIRYHEHEWDVVVAHARACGIPPATFVRNVSLGARPRASRNRLENEFILRLGRIATDLHRLARRPDESLVASDTSRLRLALDDVLAAIRRIG
jgi:hypothetical protein